MASFALACPLCSQPGFQSLDSLRDGLISAATRFVVCPVCQETLPGLDKFTLHLFSHSVQQRSVASQSLHTVHTATQTDHALDTLAYCDDLFQETSAENTPASEAGAYLSCAVRPESNCFDQNITSLPAPARRTNDFTLETNFTSENSSDVSPTDVAKLSVAAEFVVDENPNDVSSGISRSAAEVKSCVYSCSSTELGCSPPDTAAKLDKIQYDSYNCPEIQEQHSSRCDMCGLCFPEQQILAMHQQLVHSESLNGAVAKSRLDVHRQYACYLCSKSFKMRGSLMVHLRVAHVGNSLGKVLAQKVDSDMASEEKVFSCPTCLKTFKKEHHLSQHIKTHEGKQWECDVCCKFFTTKYFLKKHKRLHTGKCFRQRVSYLVHRRIHTGVMPYKCTACNRSFRYKVSQRTHKCVSQTPGVLVRQPGDLVSRLQHMTQAKVSSDVDGAPCPSVSCADIPSRNVPVVKSLFASSVMPSTNCTSLPGGEPQEKGKELKFLGDVGQFQSVTCRSCNVGVDSNLLTKGTDGRESLVPMSNTGVKSFASEEFLDCKLHSAATNVGMGVAMSLPLSPTSDQNTLFVETSDYFAMVMSPCLLSPSERLRFLSLSPLPSEGTLHRDTSQTPVFQKDSGGQATMGTLSERVCCTPPLRESNDSSKNVETDFQTCNDVVGVCDERVSSPVGCSNNLETINEESLKQLLYGPSTS